MYNSFLNRVSLYQTRNKSGKLKDSTSFLQNEIMDEKTRKKRCSACTPKRSQEIRVTILYYIFFFSKYIFNR